MFQIKKVCFKFLFYFFDSTNLIFDFNFFKKTKDNSTSSPVGSIERDSIWKREDDSNGIIYIVF